MCTTSTAGTPTSWPTCAGWARGCRRYPSDLGRRGFAPMAGRDAVIGAGLMGFGIAQAAARAGWEVTLRDVDEATVRRALAAVRTSLERFSSNGPITSD